MLKNIMQERWKSTLNTLMLILIWRQLEAENYDCSNEQIRDFRQRYEALCSLKIERQNIFKALFLILKKH
jgi:hypothetical protein